MKKPAPTSSSTTPLLKVNNLKMHFPVRSGIFSRTHAWLKAVDGISFQIGDSETLGLVGESGCGKSTVGRTIVRLLEPTSGKITLAGNDITHLQRSALKPYRSKLQMIFQDPYSSLNPRMTAGTIVAEPLLVHKMGTTEERTKKIKDLFEQVGLTSEQMHKYPHEFSGGQRQRIGIARALALNPRLIVADEPVSALDVSIQAQVVNLLADLQKNNNLSFLFISHDLSVVRYISKRVAVMYLGRLVETAPTEKLFSKPQHPYTQALMKAIPEPKPSTTPIKVIKGEVPNPINPPSGCPFHPRCPYAEDRCKKEVPIPREIYPKHFSACHLAPFDKTILKAS